VDLSVLVRYKDLYISTKGLPIALAATDVEQRAVARVFLGELLSSSDPPRWLASRFLPLRLLNPLSPVRPIYCRRVNVDV
jgi:hypothetical protein